MPIPLALETHVEEIAGAIDRVLTREKRSKE
jgi:hypothetical protein